MKAQDLSVDLTSFDFLKSSGSGDFQTIGKAAKYSYIKKCHFKTTLTGKVLSLEVVCPEEKEQEGNGSGFYFFKTIIILGMRK